MVTQYFFMQTECLINTTVFWDVKPCTLVAVANVTGTCSIHYAGCLHIIESQMTAVLTFPSLNTQTTYNRSQFGIL